MEIRLKHRLLGTVILALIGVFTLPLFLDGKKHVYKENIETMPLVIKLDEPHVAEPLPDTAAFDSAAKPEISLTAHPLSQRSDTANLPQKTVSFSSPVEKIKRLEKTENALKKPGSKYVIQLVALKNVARVHALVAQLKKANYVVFTQPQTPIQGQIIRIYVGYEMSKEKANAMLAPLQKLTGLKGIVKTFTP